ncbi:helix-turn-helix domain-containing protein [Rugosimonospora africana]|uniref:AraC family transcriptional regulator n=1 Tax=Rugosimonospora africana TaxID=556532 RepID=A0A8J3VS66_9ACTN|nr:AraC family transcriptional regulator [Rugosimonospora africana]GIH16932.1 AraC family transcriptional regulator [Rugosimonospora africana]
MNELTVRETNGILRQPWIDPRRTSAGLGWDQLYVSTQREQPYQAGFDAAPTHLVILHLNGPVAVRRGHLGLTESRTVPPGAFFMHPAGKDLDVELGGELDTVHVYLTDAALQDAHDEDAPVRLAEELGTVDPLLEQIVLSLDGVLKHWEPSARTYVDHLGALLAAQLARRHAGTGRPVPEPKRPGLGSRQYAAVCELMRERLSEPVPLTDMAAVAGLSVSQFSRQFKARTGLAPHRFLIRLRVDAALRLLREGAMPIAEVATCCGFSHQEHLTRVFSAHLETTPAAVRRSGLTAA